jgi:hypothetical protein
LEVSDESPLARVIVNGAGTVSSEEMRGWSMTCNTQRASALTAGIWLIGLGLLIATKAWWPGILLLVGITIIVQGYFSGGQRQAIRGGIVAIAIGVWAACKFNVALLFVGLGVYIISAALLKPNPFHKPYVDNTLE